MVHSEFIAVHRPTFADASLLLQLCELRIFECQWRSQGGGAHGGQSATPDSEKFAKNLEKEGKNQEKSGKKRKNREEKAKIGKVLSLCPSWQIGLARRYCWVRNSVTTQKTSVGKCWKSECTIKVINPNKQGRSQIFSSCTNGGAMSVWHVDVYLQCICLSVRSELENASSRIWLDRFSRFLDTMIIRWGTIMFRNLGSRSKVI